ncbi:MAG: O-antigen ligase family protein [Acidobacteriaceae bacterium]
MLDFGAVYPGGILALQVGAAVLFAGWLTCSLFPGPLHFSAKPLYLPLLALGAIAGGQLALHRTAYWYTSFAEALLWSSYILLFVAASELFATERASRMALHAFATFGPLLALFALIQFFSGTDKIYWIHRPWQSSQYIFGPYVNRNHYAGVMEMLAPFAAMLGMDRDICGAAPRRALYLFGAGVMFASIFISASRAGASCAVIELLLIALLWQRRSGLPQFKAAVAAAISLIALAAFALWLDPMRLLGRAKMLHLSDELVMGRGAMTRDALKMLWAHPVLGFGLHTFPVSYPAYRSFHTNLFINELHNDFLQVFVELGMAGGTALTVFLALLYRDALRGLRRAGSLQSASLIGITGLLAHSFFDFNLHIPANAACFFVLCAWATHGYNESPKRAISE